MYADRESTDLSKGDVHINIFLISLGKYILWVLINSISERFNALDKLPFGVSYPIKISGKKTPIKIKFMG